MSRLEGGNLEAPDPWGHIVAEGADTSVDPEAAVGSIEVVAEREAARRRT